MKTIAQSVSLKGQTEEISISDLRSKPGEVFAQVALGKSFTVSKCGKVVAKIDQPENFDWAALARLRRLSK